MNAKIVVLANGKRLAVLDNGRVARLPSRPSVAPVAKKNPGALGSALLLMGAGAAGAAGMWAAVRYVPKVSGMMGLSTPSTNGNPNAITFLQSAQAANPAFSAFANGVNIATPSGWVGPVTLGNQGNPVYAFSNGVLYEYVDGNGIAVATLLIRTDNGVSTWLFNNSNFSTAISVSGSLTADLPPGGSVSGTL